MLLSKEFTHNSVETAHQATFLFQISYSRNKNVRIEANGTSLFTESRERYYDMPKEKIVC